MLDSRLVQSGFIPSYQQQLQPPPKENEEKVEQNLQEARKLGQKYRPSLHVRSPETTLPLRLRPEDYDSGAALRVPLGDLTPKSRAHVEDAPEWRTDAGGLEVVQPFERVPDFSLEADGTPRYHILEVWIQWKNTLVFLKDPWNRILCSSTAGALVGVGSRQPFGGGLRCTAESAFRASMKTIEEGRKIANLDDGIVVDIRGYGPARQGVLRCVSSAKLVVRALEDSSPLRGGWWMPHKRTPRKEYERLMGFP